MDDKIIEKAKRSVPLSKDEVAFLRLQVEEAASITDAGIKLGISKDVLTRMIAFGSCSEKTYNKIFSQQAA